MFLCTNSLQGKYFVPPDPGMFNVDHSESGRLWAFFVIALKGVCLGMKRAHKGIITSGMPHISLLCNLHGFSC